MTYDSEAKATMLYGAIGRKSRSIFTHIEVCHPATEKHHGPKMVSEEFSEYS